MKMRVLLCIARLLVATLVVLVLTGATATGASADALDDQVREIARGLRCPVCENVSTADSQSELAAQMRLAIRDQLLQGQTREQITAYFLERYGESVLFEPPKQGFSMLAWLVTPAGLLLGLVVVGRVLLARRSDVSRSPAQESLGAVPAAEAGSGPTGVPVLEHYRARVRAHLAEEPL